MAGGNGKITARFETARPFYIVRIIQALSDNSGVEISYTRRIFTRACGKRTPKGCVVPLVACKGLMRREAPNLGAGVGRQARKRAGFGAGMRPALLQVARRGCSRLVGLQVSAGVEPMQGR